jgi:hypothetical protein
VTRSVRSDELPKVTTTLRRTGEQLAHPCRCGKPGCTLGDHIWKATKAMGPGPRAANLDPTARGWRYDEDGEPIRGDDPTGEVATDLELADLHVEYMTLLNEATHWATELGKFIDRWRPDREQRSSDGGSDKQWCGNCLEFGICNPPWRGQQSGYLRCRDCYEFHLTYERLERPESLIRAKHEGRRITQKMVDQAVREARSELRKQRRRGRRSA